MDVGLVKGLSTPIPLPSTLGPWALGREEEGKACLVRVGGGGEVSGMEVEDSDG